MSMTTDCATSAMPMVSYPRSFPTKTGDPMVRKEYTCPACFQRLNRHTEITSFGDGDSPRSGDFTVCAECHHLLVFKPDYLVFGTQEDLDSFKASDPAELMKIEMDLGSPVLVRPRPPKL